MGHKAYTLENPELALKNAPFKVVDQGFDHVEFTVKSLGESKKSFLKMGFEQVGEYSGKRSQNLKKILMQQGFLRIVLTEPLPGATGNEADFLKNQAEGICVLAISVADAKSAYENTLARGAKSAMAPETTETPDGRVIRSEIFTPGNVRYAFIERQSKGLDVTALFDEGFKVSRLKSPSPLQMVTIDHLTNNINMGDTKLWVDFYTNIMGFWVSRHFDIQTGRTGLTSEVVESPCRRIKVPINEATEKASQVQEFVDRMKGSGVQHLALTTTNIVETLNGLRAQGYQFLAVPKAYYEEVPTRVPGVTEDLAELEKLGILLDGESHGYLLQIFTQEFMGPFFFELIQRRGNEGFGEGNFTALFEAIERDQVRRGVL